MRHKWRRSRKRSRGRLSGRSKRVDKKGRGEGKGRDVRVVIVGWEKRLRGRKGEVTT